MHLNPTHRRRWTCRHQQKSRGAIAPYVIGRVCSRILTLLRRRRWARIDRLCLIKGSKFRMTRADKSGWFRDRLTTSAVSAYLPVATGLEKILSNDLISQAVISCYVPCKVTTVYANVGITFREPWLLFINFVLQKNMRLRLQVLRKILQHEFSKNWSILLRKIIHHSCKFPEKLNWLNDRGGEFSI